MNIRINFDSKSLVSWCGGWMVGIIMGFLMVQIVFAASTVGMPLIVFALIVAMSVNLVVLFQPSIEIDES